MTAPTHIAFGILCSGLASADYWASGACALGALLPDLDHPLSSIGRVFFFISAPLSRLCGHRGLIHSVFLWFPLLIFGILIHAPIMQWLAIGALSHVLIDCYNTSGVRALTPFSSKSVVLFKRDWRVNTGSLGEIYVFVLIAALLPATHYAQAIGGPRRLINHLIRSPKITAEQFHRAGTRICYVEGDFRWADGRIENVQWLIVGNEGNALVYFDGSRLIRSQHGEFLRSKLLERDDRWQSVKLQGVGEIDAPAFFFDGKKWFYTPRGKVFGIVRLVNNAMPEIRTTATAVTRIGL